MAGVSDTPPQSPETRGPGRAQVVVVCSTHPEADPAAITAHLGAWLRSCYPRARIALVDADLTRGELHRYVGSSSPTILDGVAALEAGMSPAAAVEAASSSWEAIAGERALEVVLAPGMPLARAALRVRAEVYTALIETLRGSHDVVVVEAPALTGQYGRLARALDEVADHLVVVTDLAGVAQAQAELAAALEATSSHPTGGSGVVVLGPSALPARMVEAAMPVLGTLPAGRMWSGGAAGWVVSDHALAQIDAPLRRILGRVLNSLGTPGPPRPAPRVRARRRDRWRALLGG